MKFDQKIENNMENIFLKASYAKCGEETNPRPRPFLKKSKLSISLDQCSKDLYSLFLLYTKFRAISQEVKATRQWNSIS